MQSEMKRLYATRVTSSHSAYPSLLKTPPGSNAPPLTLANALESFDFSYADLEAAGFGGPQELSFPARESCEIGVKYAKLLT